MVTSVVIPAYNAERFIGSAVESVLGQSLGDLELVVVDDGSTDGTADVVGEFDDERLRCLRQENATQAAARNAGIEASSGEFVAFLDADDRWLPEKLERQIPLFSNAEVGVVYGAAEGGGAAPHRGRVLLPLVRENFLVCSSVVVRREVLERFGLRFRLGRQGSEDWDLWLRLARVTSFDFVADPCVFYRSRADGISGDKDRMYRSMMQTLDDFDSETAGAAGLEEGERARLLRSSRRTRVLETLRYGHWLLSRGRRDEARGTMFRALRMDRLNLRAWWGMAKAAL